MAVAALNQSGRGSQIFAASGDWLIIGWGWGLAVVFGVYVAGGVSGAHINPAVTLSFALRRGFPWRKVPGYMLAQLIGAFLGALLVYIVYKGAIDSVERANHWTRGDPNSVPPLDKDRLEKSGYPDRQKAPAAKRPVLDNLAGNGTAIDYQVQQSMLTAGFADAGKVYDDKQKESTGKSVIASDSRIDYIYLSGDLKKKIVRCTFLYDPFTAVHSDHKPILLELKQ